MFGFWITPSRISMARAMVSLSADAAPPESTVCRCGNRAALTSQVAEFHR